MSETSTGTTEAVQESQQIITADRLDAIGWALFFIWVGTGFLLDVGWGVGLVGIGVIILGGQVARNYFNFKLEGCWVVCGSLFLLGGLWELFSVTLPLFPVLFIVAGIALLISTLRS